jgi:tetratricopeptide (TPR) repeat protein
MPENPRIEDLRRRVQNDPASIAFAQLAEEHRRAKQYEESVNVCQAGLRIHPRYLSARITLGRALIELGRLDEARQELELVLSSAPQNLAAIRALAETHRRRGAWTEALEQYRAALVLASNDPDLERAVSELSAQAAEPALKALPATPEPERLEKSAGDNDRKALVVLEQWLAAIHGTRAHPRP